MADINKLIATLEYCLEYGSIGGHECFRRYYNNGNITETNARANCPNKDCQTGCVATTMHEVIALLKTQKPVKPHRNYQYLSDYWCECGWHLGKAGSVKYCSECGRRIEWNG